MALSLIEKLLKSPFTKKRRWRIFADNRLVAEGFYQALILVNGYLGPELPFSDKPLGSGEFYLFGLKDIGMLKLLSQAKHARNGSIMDDPVRWGLESVVAKNEIELVPDTGDPFPANVDGSTFLAEQSMTFSRVDQIPLINNGSSSS